MASSSVQVCNMALQLLGAKPIASLTEGTKAASLCDQFFADCRDEMLREHAWNFATKRAELGQDTTGPLFGYLYSYQLPTNPLCLRVLELKEDVPYVIEGRSLLTDANTATIKYIGQITSPSVWDASFTKAFVAHLAYYLAYPLTESIAVQDRMAKLAEYRLAEARSADSQEGSTQTADNAILVDVRRTNSLDRRSGWTM